MAPSGFSVILVPTGRSEPPRAALEVALALARDGARLVVARVGEAPDAVAAPPCACQAAATAVGPDLRFEVVRRHGPAAEVLIALADELGCELIVIGDVDEIAANDGHGGMGDVAQQLLHHAACPVLCLPGDPHPPVPAPPPYPPPHGTFADPATAPGA